MRTVATYAVATIAGVAAGLASFQFALSLQVGDLRIGPWSVNLAMGSPSAGPYARAWTAIHGLLALEKTAAIYFYAYEDSDGAALSARCSYAVTGRDPEAAWWSITVYGADGYLIRDAAGRYSQTAASVPRLSDGSFEVILAGSGTPAAAGAGALPTGNGSFNLDLRLYDPGARVLGDPAQIAVPRIIRRGCT